MSYEDKNLVCRDCNASFIFSAGEQEFHAEKGFTNSPSRCPECRAKRKATGGFGGGSRGMGGTREMHTAICSECGREARVPFVPRGDKPVYCSDCFQNQRSGSRW
ncbi:MAG TPA: zinc-ribbon domain containing protein [Armatimonadota bacterium]